MEKTVASKCAALATVLQAMLLASNVLFWNAANTDIGLVCSGVTEKPQINLRLGHKVDQGCSDSSYTQYATYQKFDMHCTIAPAFWTNLPSAKALHIVCLID